MVFNELKGNISYIFLIVGFFLFLNTGCVANKKIPDSKLKHPIAAVGVDLPTSDQWTRVTDQENTGGYIREWVLKGATGKNTEWIIVEQKFVQKGPVSAMKFTKGMYFVAKKMCEDVKYLKPISKPIQGYDSVLGWVICSRQKGLNYGTFTHQRVITDQNIVYVVTSELRMPPTKKAGLFAFGKNERHKMKPFLARVKQSKLFVQNAVDICVDDAKNCTK